jgi:hypothetical protein
LDALILRALGFSASSVAAEMVPLDASCCEICLIAAIALHHSGYCSLQVLLPPSPALQRFAYGYLLPVLIS